MNFSTTKELRTGRSGFRENGSGSGARRDFRAPSQMTGALTGKTGSTGYDARRRRRRRPRVLYFRANKGAEKQNTGRKILAAPRPLREFKFSGLRSRRRKRAIRRKRDAPINERDESVRGDESVDFRRATRPTRKTGAAAPWIGRSTRFRPLPSSSRVISSEQTARNWNVSNPTQTRKTSHSSVSRGGKAAESPGRAPKTRVTTRRWVDDNTTPDRDSGNRKIHLTRTRFFHPLETIVCSTCSLFSRHHAPERRERNALDQTPRRTRSP